MNSTLESFPSMDVYHCTRVRRTRLSPIIRVTKATSPPGVTISEGEPVQAVNGGRDFRLVEWRRSAGEE